MGEKDDVPSTEQQQEILRDIFNRPVIVGDTWYLIDSKWIKSLKLFIGFEKWESSTIAHPGPIDNYNLFDESTNTLKKGLIDCLDYELIHEEGWNLLMKWYGLSEGQKPIARKAIRAGNLTPVAIVEVYLLVLTCVKDFDFKIEEKIEFSKTTTCREIDSRLRSVFNIDPSIKTRLWQMICTDKYEALQLDKTAQSLCINEHQKIIIEAQRPDGTWPKQHLTMVLKTSRCQHNSIVNSTQPKSSSSMTSLVISPAVGPSTSGSPLITPRSQNMPSTSTSGSSHSLKHPGLCGLINLGNTCFMNSVIQCMSNCPPITEYFLSGKHLSELNESNPLGMKGEIAKVYGELIATLWSGKHSYTNPQKFKTQVGIFNTTFCGCQQHDSQELLTFLLDGLHEDLNRIFTKPYIPIRDESGREDEIVAKETWENYRKRNDSIIVDTFHGLLKSRVICPECERLSLTFDPFCYLSLPLPLKKDRAILIRYIPYESLKRESKYTLIVPKKGTIRDLCIEMQGLTSGNPDHMLVAEITNCHFHRFFCNDDSLDTIDEKDIIYVFQLNIVPNPLDADFMIFPVCFWQVSDPIDAFLQKHIFGIPFLLVLPRKPISSPELHRELLDKMQRHFNYYSSSDTNIHNGGLQLEIVTDRESNYLDALFKLYVIDTSLYDNPEKLELNNDGEYDLPETLFGKDVDQCFGRRALLLQFTNEQKRECYKEKTPEEHSFPNITREKSKITIRDCLQLFTTCEKLSADDAWYCPTCQQHQRATKKFDLWKLPRILIIHLKRFSYSRYRRDKIETLVEFPLTGLCMSEYVINSEQSPITYDLVGVCNHYGSLGGGHYTAYCKHKDLNEWYSFDDNVVSPISSDLIMSNAAYVLFYMAKECKDPADHEFMDVN